jgi:hypothetical protein
MLDSWGFELSLRMNIGEYIELDWVICAILLKVVE